MSPERPRSPLLALALGAALVSSCAHAPRTEPAWTGAAGTPSGLGIALERVRALVASAPAAPVRDLALEAWLSEVDREVFAETGRHVLPFRLGGPREPSSPVSSTYGGTDAVLRDADALSSSARYGYVERSLVLVDGDASIGFVRDSIVIVTGHLDVAHAFDCVLVSGDTLEVSHAGMASRSERLPVLLATGATLRVSFAHRAILVAPDGTNERTEDGAILLSSFALDRTRGPRSALLPALAVPRTRSPLEDELEVAIGAGRTPRACVYRRGASAPLACGVEGGPLSGELSGWRVVFSDRALVVLGRGDERARLVPRPDRLPAGAGTLEAPRAAEVHAVGFYEPRVPFARVAVRLERHAPRGVVLVLMSYDAVQWDLEVAEGVELVGIVLAGYEISTVRGAPPGTPVVTRIDELGERGLYAYEPGGAEYAAFTQGLAEILSHPPVVTSFTGSYIAPPAVTLR